MPTDYELNDPAIAVRATLDGTEIWYAITPDGTDYQVPGSALDARFLGASLTVDTQAAILATSPASPSLAFATDTASFMVWSGSDWYEVTMSLIVSSFGQLDFSDEDNSAWIGVF